MQTALDFLGTDKYNHYKELHFMDASMISGRIRYIKKDDLYRDMRHNFALYYADFQYSDLAKSSKWLKSYDYILSLDFSDLVKVAEELYRKGA